ncbi:MAG: HAD-IA family hydrolase [Planctomycetes bacterium]|nr:HAD-IA family hydrolase [Planctomycetota bacterium]
MNCSTGITGVIFDMDGVLCDSERFICEAAIEMFKRRHGVQVRAEDFLPFVGSGENRYLGGVAEKYGVQIKLPEDKVFTYELYLEVIRNRLKALPGVSEFILKCRAKGIKLAVASAADTMKVNGNLAEIGLPHETFDAVVTGSDVSRHKPDPQCFLMAAKKIGICPANCLVIEDANNGCKAAKAAGAMCLGITSSFDSEQLAASGADWTASDLAHLPGDLEAILAVGAK